MSLHHADEVDTKTVGRSLEAALACQGVLLGGDAPCASAPVEVIGDKGYHSREVLKALPEECRSRISEPLHRGRLRWHGDTRARDAVYANRARLGSAKGKALMRARAELVERSFAHCLDRGGMQRVWLRGLENIGKRYLIHVAGFNLGVLTRALFGVGTPKGWAEAPCEAFLAFFSGQICCLFALWPPVGEHNSPRPLIICLELLV